MKFSSARISILLVLILWTIPVSAQQQPEQQTFGAAQWLEDFARLKREMSAGYANLEWAIEERGLDLKQLSDETESSLRKARDRAEAQQAIEIFLRRFADAHLRIEWTTNGKSDESPFNSEAAPRRLCERLGYRPNPNAKPGVAFSALKNFRALENESSKYLPAGVINLNDGKKIGVLRIALFMESVFPDLCAQAVAESRLADDAECADECAERVSRRVSNLLTGRLAAQIGNLKREKIDALLVDITSNGGGTNWYEPAARSLTAKPLRSAAFGFIRHKHWTRQLKERLLTVENETRKTSAPRLKKLLARMAGNLRREIAETEKPCDRLGVWENRKLDCSLIVAAEPVLPYAAPGELPDADVSRLLFGASYFHYREGVYTGKLLVLIDQRTASSAEAFAAMLGDNGAATIVGQPSMGAGCGYTNGGIEIVLKNSGGRVKMPDCVRFRADGSNEAAGITPDISIPWRQNDTAFQKAKRTLEMLEKISTSK